MKTGEAIYEIGIELDGCINDPMADDVFEAIKDILSEKRAVKRLRGLGIENLNMDLTEKRRVQ